MATKKPVKRRIVKATETVPAPTEYTEFHLPDQIALLKARIKELEASHYAHGLALMEVDALITDQSADEIHEAKAGREHEMEGILRRSAALRKQLSVLEETINE